MRSGQSGSVAVPVEVRPSRVYVRFYAELNDHLPRDQRQKAQEKSFLVPGTVKDIIESLGVPHTEVELIVVNGESVPFSYVVRNGDRIAVYPIFESFDVTAELRVRPQVLRETKFILDVHLGKLAAYLRMLGFDTVYGNGFGDAELVRISSEQHRILLTRDRGLLKYRAVTHGHLLRETDSRRQLAEIMTRFDLARSVRPFTRCMVCNEFLTEIAKERVRAALPTRVVGAFEEFRQCSRCGRIYWKGSHYQRMQRWVSDLVTGAGVQAKESHYEDFR
jgi:hypothetical protein